jgi:hypothetical protein
VSGICIILITTLKDEEFRLGGLDGVLKVAFLVSGRVKTR